MTYNAPFFDLFENTFKLLKAELGSEKTLVLFTKIMHTGLENAYGTDFVKGSPQEFGRIVSLRDQMVGLRVQFPQIDDNTIVYQFHDDPFPNLQGLIDESHLDKSYLDFKIKYILGDGWHYRTTKHFWWGDDYTEHVIDRKHA